MSYEDKSQSLLADPIEFAREGGFRSGRVAVASLDRLQDLLADGAGSFSWEVSGREEADAAGGSRKFLRLEAEGDLLLVCQRCLGPMDFHLRLDSSLELMAPDQEWPEEELEDDTCDAIEATQDMELVPLLEDEILLALPPVPRHEACLPPGTLTGQAEAPEAPEASGMEKVSPFAVLAGLKKEKH